MPYKIVLKVLRAGLWILLILWTGYGLKHGWQSTADVYQLHNSGKKVTAQVIGHDQTPPTERTGYVHYAFNEGSRSIENKMPVPIELYSQFSIGTPIEVTYLPSEPHLIRVGDVTSGTVTRSLIFAVLFVVVGLLAFGLPLIAVQATLKPRPSSSSSASASV